MTQIKCDNLKRAFALPKSDRSTDVPCAMTCIVLIYQTRLATHASFSFQNGAGVIRVYYNGEPALFR